MHCSEIEYVLRRHTLAFALMKMENYTERLTEEHAKEVTLNSS